MNMEIDNNQALTELTAAFEAYERALVAGDVTTVNALFWSDPRTVRYGTTDSERHYGHAAIAAFRSARGPIKQNRRLQNTKIVTFGDSFGVANTEFMLEGAERVGRQSQTWMCTPQGWKIVSAHVSYGADKR
jgi:AtzH-like